MNLEPTESQQAVVEAVRSLCDDYFSSSGLHELAEGGSYEKAWGAMKDMGIFNLTRPEEKGGAGLGYTDSVLVFEELGKSLAPGPILGTYLASELSLDSISGLIMRQDKSILVENPDFIQNLLVLDEKGIWQIDLKELKLVNAEFPLDPLTPVAFLDGAKLPQGEKLGDAKASRRIAQIGNVMLSAYKTGLASGATDLAVEYAKERQQFGVIIGSFQAVKHICADMLTRVEVARAAVYVAGVVLGDPMSGNEPGDGDSDFSAAGVLSSQAASLCGQDCVQVHGGMGYTWEADPHLYLKRAWVLEQVLDTADSHAEFLASHI